MDKYEIIDTGMAPEIYSDGIAYVENLGTCCRVLFYTYTSLSVGEPLRRVVVAKIVRPISSLQRGIVSQMLSARIMLSDDGQVLN